MYLRKVRLPSSLACGFPYLMGVFALNKLTTIGKCNHLNAFNGCNSGDVHSSFNVGGCVSVDPT
eukprot:9713520-Ditylum_brightwellii.AAC.1